MSDTMYVNSDDLYILRCLSGGYRSLHVLAEGHSDRNDPYSSAAVDIAIHRLLTAGLIEVVGSTNNSRHTVYRITSLGQDTLKKKLEQLQGQLQEQQQQRSVSLGVRGASSDTDVESQGKDEKIQDAALRLDTAVPSNVYINQTFDLAAKVIPVSFDTLEEEGLDLVKSAAADISWRNGQREVSLRIKVQAPNCTIHGESETEFRLKRAQASPTFYFQLSPLVPGRSSIIVQLFQETFCLGSVRVATVVTGPQASAAQNFVLSTQAKQEGSNTASIACAHLYEDRSNVLDLILVHRRRLKILEKKKALQGINTPPEIIIEIEDIREQMTRLTTQLGKH